MARNKTLSKRIVRLGDISPIPGKGTARLAEHDPSAFFHHPEKVAEALIESLFDGDPEAFKEILAAYLRVANKSQLAQRAGIPSRTLFRMLSPEGNPRLDSVAKLLKSLRQAA